MEANELTVASLARFSGGYRVGEAVLRDVSVSFPSGSLTAVVGPNGAGKSTLLRALACALPAHCGDYRIGGVDAYSLSARDVARSVALMATVRVVPSLTVMQYVLLGRTPHRGLFSLSDSAEQRAMAIDALSMFDIENLKDKEMHALSDGQRQMASLARAIVQEPRLLLLDEPTSNLDPSNAQKILFNIIKVVRQKNIAAVAVMHDVNSALQWSDKALIVKNGGIVCSGDTRDILTPDNLSAAFDVRFSCQSALLPQKNVNY